jgi:large subunit ribosomal protein L35
LFSHALALGKEASATPQLVNQTSLPRLPPAQVYSATESGFRLYFAVASAITPPFRRPAERAAVATVHQHAQPSKIRPAGLISMPAAAKESQMPKLKTKSGAKKRFKVTANGMVLYQQSRKRHGMIKRTKKQIRQLRGTAVLFKTDGDKIKKYYLPNG